MKTAVYSILRPIVGVDAIWRVLDVALRLARMLDTARGQVVNARGPAANTQAALARLCPDARVQSGLCRGLRFPANRSFFSTIAPMMLGLYESPLQQALEKLVTTTNYDLIVDIGSADGFYAVGLAMRCPQAQVIAFDTEARARAATAATAQCNDVGDRVTVRGFCSATDLLDVVRRASRALILSDCEGYERELFPLGSGSALAAHDLVIELHDSIDYGISPHLKSVFRNTHDIEVLRGQDDVELVRSAHLIRRELETFDWNTRHTLVAENRRTPGEWLIARSQGVQKAENDHPSFAQIRTPSAHQLPS